MRVYNGTNSQLDLPLSGSQRISISSHSVSGDIMPSIEFLSLLVGSYKYEEIALIVSGPFEITLCSSVSGCAGFVCQSLEEAIERFSSKKEEDKKVDTKEKKELSESNPKQEEAKANTEKTTTTIAAPKDQNTTPIKEKVKENTTKVKSDNNTKEVETKTDK